MLDKAAVPQPSALTVTARHDAAEREAERAVSQPSSSAPRIRHAPRDARDGGTVAGNNDLGRRLAQNRGRGEPLSATARSAMEQRLGFDFASVRVHRDGEAAHLNRALGSLSFAHGPDLYFRDGTYAPGTPSGDRLLAHELTHVVQQAGAAQRYVQLQEDPSGIQTLPPELKEVEGDANRIAASLDNATYFTEADEKSVLQMLYYWAFKPNPPSVTIPGSFYLMSLFSKLKRRTTTSGYLQGHNTVSYYALLFSRFSGQPLRELHELRNYLSPWDKKTSDLVDGGISWELKNAAPAASTVTTSLPVTESYKRVLGWLQNNKAGIVAAETKFSIDRRAMAGAIAWEALENVQSSLRPKLSSAGPGKVHTTTGPRVGGTYVPGWLSPSRFNPKTSAEQTEDEGYLPAQTPENRKKILETTSGSIEYIAAIMKLGADIAFDEKGYEISTDPPILAYYFNAMDPTLWRAKLKAKKAGEPLAEGDMMGRWVRVHMAYLEEAVGTPAFKPSHVKPAAAGAGAAAPVQRALATEDQPCVVPQAVGDITRSPGQPIDPAVLAHMEGRFGHDFRAVRVHADTEAALAADLIHANAYTIASHVVFARGRYRPSAPEGRSLLAHELAHVVQQSTSQTTFDGIGEAHSVLEREAEAAATAFRNDRPTPRISLGNTFRARGLVQRDPKPDAGTPPPADRFERIAQEVFGAASYADYVSTKLTSAPFFSNTINNVHPDVAPMLKAAETSLKAADPTFVPPGADSTLRRKGGMHGFGMAIDFDVLRNPYVLNESGEGQLDKELVVVYDRIAKTMLAKASSDLRRLTGGRTAFGGVGQAYDKLAGESDAMRQYFAMRNNDAAIATFLTTTWPTLHPGEPAPDAAVFKAQIRDDYEVLGGATAAGTKRPSSSGDRPFAPRSAGGQGDPATGFLNLSRPFVIAMTDAGFAWGAIDIAGEPGDIQHFDLRRVGTGKRVYDLLQRYR